MSLDENFVSEVTKKLISRGYSSIDGRSTRYQNLTGYYLKVISLDINRSSRRCSVKPVFLIRNDRIGDIRKEFNPKLHKGDFYFTVITQQYSLATKYELDDFKIPRYIIKDSSTLTSALNNFFQFLDLKAFSFLEGFKSLNDFDEWFNSPILNGYYDFQRGNILHDMIEGLISAKMNQNPHFEELYEIWIKSINPNYVEALEVAVSLKGYLDNI